MSGRGQTAVQEWSVRAKIVNTVSKIQGENLTSEAGSGKAEEKVRRIEELKELERLEIEELKIAKDIVSVILEKLGQLAKDVVNTIMSSLDGKKLGQEIAELYSNLKTAGLSDRVIEEMVKDFYKKKLELVPSLNELVRVLSTAMSEYMKPSRKEEKEEKTG